MALASLVSCLVQQACNYLASLVMLLWQWEPSLLSCNKLLLSLTFCLDGRRDLKRCCLSLLSCSIWSAILGFKKTLQNRQFSYVCGEMLTQARTYLKAMLSHVGQAGSENGSVNVTLVNSYTNPGKLKETYPLQPVTPQASKFVTLVRFIERWTIASLILVWLAGCLLAATEERPHSSLRLCDA